MTPAGRLSVDLIARRAYNLRLGPIRSIPTMKSFLRSLRYLWPYRLRLAFAAFWVLLIALLWGGGLGMIAPALKVLISDEGLHGWAWNAMAQDRLGLRVVQRRLSVKQSQAHGLPALAIDIVSVSEPSHAGRAGLKPLPPGTGRRLLRGQQEDSGVTFLSPSLSLVKVCKTLIVCLNY